MALGKNTQNFNDLKMCVCLGPNYLSDSTSNHSPYSSLQVGLLGTMGVTLKFLLPVLQNVT